MNRRETLWVAGAGLTAVLAGGVAGALALQWRSGAARLLSASFVDLAGKPRTLRDWRGSVCLINFWATWCEPCREEVPLLVAAQQQHRGSGLVVVGIGIDHVAKIREFTAKYGLNYVNLVAGAEALDLVRALGNRGGGLPFSVILDRSGTVVLRRLGAFGRAELEQALVAMLR